MDGACQKAAGSSKIPCTSGFKSASWRQKRVRQCAKEPQLRWNCPTRPPSRTPEHAKGDEISSTSTELPCSHSQSLRGSSSFCCPAFTRQDLSLAHPHVFEHLVGEENPQVSGTHRSERAHLEGQRGLRLTSGSRSFKVSSLSTPMSCKRCPPPVRRGRASAQGTLRVPPGLLRILGHVDEGILDLRSTRLNGVKRGAEARDSFQSKWTSCGRELAAIFAIAEIADDPLSQRPRSRDARQSWWSTWCPRRAPTPFPSSYWGLGLGQLTSLTWQHFATFCSPISP